MKDNMTLLAAAAGGFMLSIAFAGILRAAPVTSWEAQPSLNSTPVAQLQLKYTSSDEPAEYSLKRF